MLAFRPSPTPSDRSTRPSAPLSRGASGARSGLVGGRLDLGVDLDRLGGVPGVEALAQGGDLALAGGESVARSLPDRLDARLVRAQELAQRAGGGLELGR